VSLRPIMHSLGLNFLGVSIKFASRLAQAWFVLGLRADAGNPQSIWELFAKEGLITVGANRGIGARDLVIEWNTAPAILHQESYC
jgi:hypothetical protein